jgi:hypothetical protein
MPTITRTKPEACQRTEGRSSWTPPGRTPRPAADGSPISGSDLVDIPERSPGWLLWVLKWMAEQAGIVQAEQGWGQATWWLSSGRDW